MPRRAAVACSSEKAPTHQSRASSAVTVSATASAGVRGADRYSTGSGAGWRSSRARRDATVVSVFSNWSCMRSRWAMITSFRVPTSGADSTALTSSTGMPRSRNRRMTWAVATWAGR